MRGSLYLLRVAAIYLALLVLVVMCAPPARAAPTPPPPCLPKQIAGTGTVAIVRTNAAGLAFGWGCVDDFSRSTPTYWFRWAEAVPNWQSLAADTVAKGDSATKTALTGFALASQDASGAYIVPQEVYSLVVDVFDVVNAQLPPPVAWKVAPNGSYTTRTAYAWSNGIRATVGTARATVGAKCYCDARSVEGSVVYCAVNQPPTYVSVCSKR